MSSTEKTTGKKSNKNYAKYRFGGISLNKRRLVLSVVKDYKKKYPDITSEELRTVFGNIFKSVKTASDVTYFTDPADVIKTGDRKRLAVYNQWTKNTFDNFILSIRKIGYKIKLA